ncbi:DUF3800 domain-containing protein [Trueperella pecoris]|uniref:DUF3800 domain-containing protein n=1 Tax=Trueperella pecoris TaxID=2733571 RepID=A0A7M1QZK5_9ACTO|nr:DUF3800 domain-containing protein [Trueperella pecoris]QOR47316.1 DUF3800 domain-containing protein [Trueperella pecoris]
MLIAYLDEIGEPGGFISHEHPRFNTSPAFGYAGFIIRDDHVRRFGAEVQRQRDVLFSTKRQEANSLPRDEWQEKLKKLEVKGSDYFRTNTQERMKAHLRVFDSLVKNLTDLGGALFYYADEKLTGTEKQVSYDRDSLERGAMQETLNRLARHANSANQQIFVIMDQVNESQRLVRTHQMYGHVFSRQSDFPEMFRLVESPMHLDSTLSPNIQFADWVAALVGKAVDYQLVENSKHGWVSEKGRLKFLEASNRPFTFESKLHFYARAIDDLNHAEIFHKRRRKFPDNCITGIDDQTAEKMRRIAAATQRKENKK